MVEFGYSPVVVVGILEQVVGRSARTVGVGPDTVVGVERSS